MNDRLRAAQKYTAMSLLDLDFRRRLTKSESDEGSSVVVAFEEDTLKRPLHAAREYGMTNVVVHSRDGVSFYALQYNSFTPFKRVPEPEVDVSWDKPSRDYEC